MKTFLASITLVVLAWQPTAQAATQYLSYTFGHITVGTTSEIDLQITNDGTEALTFSHIQIDGSEFSAYTNCPMELKANETCNVTTRFQPLFQGFYYGRLTVDFSNGDSIILDVDGFGDSRY